MRRIVGLDAFAISLRAAVAAVALVAGAPPLRAAVTSGGDVAPVPPAAGGAFAGPFRVGNVDVATMSITGGTAISHTGPAIVGDTVTGIGIINMSGLGSDWTLTTAGGDLTVGNSGAGSLNLSSLARLSVNDDLFLAAQLNSMADVSVTGFGTVLDVGDDANVGQRGHALVEVLNGGRLVTDANIVGDEAAGDGRVRVDGQFSLWRASSTIVVADAGRGSLRVLNGARVENTGGAVAQQAGSAGAVEVIGAGSLWQSSLNLVVGEFGHGSLLIDQGGRVVNGGGANAMLVGRQVGSFGRADVRGPGSLLAVSLLDVGDSGDGALRILDGGRVTSGISVLGDNAAARGEALVDGAGSTWEVSGLDVADLGEAHLTVSGGGLVRASSQVNVGPGGRVTLGGGRIECGGAVFQVRGVLEGHGTIETATVTNIATGRLRPRGPGGALVLTGALVNFGAVDADGGELSVLGPANNSSAIDARNGAVLRFGGAGLHNNPTARFAVTSGTVDVFGSVLNDAGADIVIGGAAVAVFHDAVTNNGTFSVQPGGKVLMLEDLAFAGGSALSVQLAPGVLADPDADPLLSHGQIDVGGPAMLAGSLHLALADGQRPAEGTVFPILSGDSLTGQFASVTGFDLGKGLHLRPVYTPTGVTLVATQAGPGDADLNGVVDADDYVLTDAGFVRGLNGWGNGDFNDDGVVDAADYHLSDRAFATQGGPLAAGTPSAAAPSAAVPEPAAGLLALAGPLGLLSRRRRYSR